MGKIPMVYSGDTLSFFIDGVPYQADSSMLTYEAVKAELRSDEPDADELIRLVQPAQAIADAVAVAEADYLPKGTVSVTKNSVSYNGETISGVLVDRILELLAEGFDIMPMVRFLENLYTNPADFARDELYLWLEGSNLPITEDGHFLAYKNVRGDFKSIHDGRTDNTPGKVVSMPREDVDPVRDRTCSRGLHFCSASYLPSFSHSYNGHTVLLKINPADVVSIPSDYNNAKGRAWKYEVLQVVEIDPQTYDWAAVVAPDASPSLPKTGYDPRKHLAGFDPGSQVAKDLFAACNKIGLGCREDRLDWAYDRLLENDMEPDVLESFNDLSEEQTEFLRDVAEAEAVEIEAARQRDAIKVVQNININANHLDEQRKLSDHLAEQRKLAQAERERRSAYADEVARINSLGIIGLRREASARGYQGAWKGPRAQDLRDFLISRLQK